MEQEQLRQLKEIKPVSVGVPYRHISATCPRHGDIQERIKDQQIEVYQDGSTSVIQEWWASSVPVCDLCQEAYIKRT